MLMGLDDTIEAFMLLCILLYSMHIAGMKVIQCKILDALIYKYCDMSKYRSSHTQEVWDFGTVSALSDLSAH